MPKKCILCDKEAEYSIKGCSESYCKQCAIEQFHDTDYLQRIQEESKKIVALVDDALEEGISDDEEMSEEE